MRFIHDISLASAAGDHKWLLLVKEQSANYTI
jgi:hypothetical protein